MESFTLVPTVIHYSDLGVEVFGVSLPVGKGFLLPFKEHDLGVKIVSRARLLEEDQTHDKCEVVLEWAFFML